MDALWDKINTWDVIHTNTVVAQEGVGFGQPTQQSLSNLLEEIGITNIPNSVFIDLGSGTGTVLFHIALYNISKKVYGVELLNKLVKESHWRQVELEKDDILQDNIVIIKEMNIMDLNQDILNTWTENNQLPLIIYSFDAVMLEFVVDKMRDLVAGYNGNVTWITTWSSYRLGLPMKKLGTKMLIGPAGVTEKDKHLVTMGDQHLNYPPEEWIRIEESKENQMHEKENMKRYIASDCTLPTLGRFEIYVYKSEQNVSTCIICQTPTMLGCPMCKKVYYCSVECQTKDNTTHQTICK